MGFASFHVPFLGFQVASFFIQGLEGVSCPNRWFLFEQNCYGFFETKLSWNDAETECTSHNKNAHLASILSEREMETISSVLLYYEEPFRVWIGLFKNKARKMKWLDKSMVDYLPLAPLQPSDTKETRNCFELYGNDYKTWNNQLCETKQPYLCKMPLY